METVNGVRILWKYIDKHSRDVHFSWERWDKRSSHGFWEFRLPPEKD